MNNASQERIYRILKRFDPDKSIPVALNEESLIDLALSVFEVANAVHPSTPLMKVLTDGLKQFLSECDAPPEKK